jgi:hypothetical protein
MPWRFLSLGIQATRWSGNSLELVAQSDFGPQGTATFLMEVRNTGNAPVKVNSSEFGPTLLGLSPKGPFCTSDGKSEAWFTRVNLVNSSSWESGSGSAKYSASYIIDPKSRPPERFQLEHGQSMKVRVTFKVPPGQYQFIVGYGGGVHEEKSVASNAISFDLNDAGIATLAKPELSSVRTRNRTSARPTFMSDSVSTVNQRLHLVSQCGQLFPHPPNCVDGPASGAAHPQVLPIGVNGRLLIFEFFVTLPLTIEAVG